MRILPEAGNGLKFAAVSTMSECPTVGSNDKNLKNAGALQSVDASGGPAISECMLNPKWRVESTSRLVK